MKYKLLILAMTLFFISCSNDKKVAEIEKQTVLLKSDILLQSTANRPFSNPNKKDAISLTISGKTILTGIATFKVVNDKGKELHCKTFSSKELIQPEYMTANPVLQEAHIREVVEGFFVDDLLIFNTFKSYAGL